MSRTARRRSPPPEPAAAPAASPRRRAAAAAPPPEPPQPPKPAKTPKAKATPKAKTPPPAPPPAEAAPPPPAPRRTRRRAATELIARGAALRRARALAEPVGPDLAPDPAGRPLGEVVAERAVARVRAQTRLDPEAFAAEARARADELNRAVERFVEHIAAGKRALGQPCAALGRLAVNDYHGAVRDARDEADEVAAEVRRRVAEVLEELLAGCDAGRPAVEAAGLADRAGELAAVATLPRPARRLARRLQAAGRIDLDPDLEAALDS